MSKASLNKPDALGTGLLAGVDEVGRGPIAGPVVAAAVVLNPNCPITGLADSKKLTQKRRESLCTMILDTAIAVGIGQASVEEIDCINILQASLLAMQRAVENLGCVPDGALIDGNQCPKLFCNSRTIVNGDSLIPEISAASIVAKVYRDRMMVDFDHDYPGYGFSEHKGYPTARHLDALRLHGVSDIHRRSFRPVRDLIV